MAAAGPIAFRVVPGWEVRLIPGSSIGFFTIACAHHDVHAEAFKQGRVKIKCFLLEVELDE